MPHRLTPRILGDLLVIAALVTSGVFAQAFAEAAAQSSFGVALVNQLPAIITSVAALIVGVLTLFRQSRTHEVATQVKAETAEIKKDVNSQFEEMKRKVLRGEEEIAALKREIAGRPGSTTEERVRADVATERVQEIRGSAPIPTAATEGKPAATPKGVTP